MSTTFTALQLIADEEGNLPKALEVITDPMAYHRRNADYHRAEGVPVKEVVIKIGDEEEELTFDEFEARYCQPIAYAVDLSTGESQAITSDDLKA